MSIIAEVQGNIKHIEYIDLKYFLPLTFYHSIPHLYMNKEIHVLILGLLVVLCNLREVRESEYSKHKGL